MSEHTQHLKELFAKAASIDDPAKRGNFLAQACENEPALRKQLDDLLEAHEAATDFIPLNPASNPSKAKETALTEAEGSVIGRYKLLQNIGEGGCGVVYMAEQQQPVTRRVALKIIKLGMDTKQVVARFEAERQALAMMEHPNIAKVLDAGATDTGRPFFVMELVRGIPITEFCDQHQLDMRSRLELFMDVCSAIQHAHQKGVIHRDIKPSNIMVSMHDHRAVPKIIDFGIAKATQQKLTDKTLFTQFHHFIGTPAYMSPEQANISGLDVDTRSDIYSLGVLLYELMTGRTPLDAQELTRADYDEMRRRIREEEPIYPSTQVSGMQESDLSAVARRRNTEPSRLNRLMQGELDWIVMKALE
ncbi:MAG: serine/threonine protein kinase, partial [Limisphaerales bacterium]